MQTGTWAEILSPRYAAATVMFTIGVGLHAFNVFIASTTMPGAAVELDAVQLLSWATSAYLILSIVGGAAAAWLKSRFGSRATLLGSSLAFVLGSAAFACADSVGVLVLGRALQGAGEGIVIACCYALIPEMFPKALVPRLFALESVVWVSAAFGGPAVAGALSELVSWRAAILSNVPVAIAFMILVPLCVPNGAAATARRFGVPALQLALIAAGVLALSASAAAGDAGGAVALLAAGSLLLCAVWAADRRRTTSARLFPHGAFNMFQPLGAGLMLVLLMCVAETPSAIFVAFAGQRIWSLSALEAGFLTAVVAIAWSLTAIWVAHMPRFTTRFHVGPAPMILACGLALIGAALALGSLPIAVVGQILVGVGFGFSWARLCEHIMDIAPPGERDFAVAAIPTVQSVGLSIGAAFFGTAASGFGLKADQSSAEIAAAIAPLFASAAVLAASLTLVARRAA